MLFKNGQPTNDLSMLLLYQLFTTLTNHTNDDNKKKQNTIPILHTEHLSSDSITPSTCSISSCGNKTTRKSLPCHWNAAAETMLTAAKKASMPGRLCLVMGTNQSDITAKEAMGICSAGSVWPNGQSLDQESHSYFPQKKNIRPLGAIFWDKTKTKNYPQPMSINS